MVPKGSTIDFDPWLSELPEILLAYDISRVRLFMASCCERQQANYTAFSTEVNWGDSIVLREAGDTLWRLAETPSTPYLNAIIRQLQKVTPDTEDFSSDLTSAALDAAVSMQEAMEYLIDSDTAHCVTICSMVRDTIRMYLEQESFLSISELEIRELSKQQADLRTLAELPEFTPSVVDLFRRCSIPNGKSNLDR